MNNPSTSPRELDQFESALLTELRDHVAERSAPDSVIEPVRSRSHYRRWAAGLAVAAAAAMAFVVGSPGGPAVSSAYAIVQEADGDVVVTIHRLEDAEGLEAALQEHGIDAEVSFETTSINSFPTPGLTGLPPHEDVIPDCGAASDPATLSRESDEWVLRIPADSPLQDRTVYMATSSSGSLKLAYESLNDPWSACAVLTGF